MQKTILCYGDSNTWGYVPMANHDDLKSRYPRHIRWPGVLQQLLGQDAYVVEEGLNSRTTNVDYQRPPNRNGMTYLPPCLYSHAPIDLVIFALGGNDLKTYFNRDAKAITYGMAALIDATINSSYGPKLSQAPRVLLMPPILPHPFTEDYVDEDGVLFLKGACAKAKALIDAYRQLAAEMNCDYLDVNHAVKASLVDGAHLDEAAHLEMAKCVAEKVKTILR